MTFCIMKQLLHSVFVIPRIRNQGFGKSYQPQLSPSSNNCLLIKGSSSPSGEFWTTAVVMLESYEQHYECGDLLLVTRIVPLPWKWNKLLIN